MKMGDPEYRQLGRRYAQLALANMRRGLTLEEQHELDAISNRMAQAEANYRPQRALTEDYGPATREAGNLGTVQL